MRTYTTDRYAETTSRIERLLSEQGKPDPVQWERSIRAAWRVLRDEENICLKVAREKRYYAPYEVYKLWARYSTALRENGPRREAFAANKTS